MAGLSVRLSPLHTIIQAQLSSIALVVLLKSTYTTRDFATLLRRRLMKVLDLPVTVQEQIRQTEVALEEEGVPSLFSDPFDDEDQICWSPGEGESINLIAAPYFIHAVITKEDDAWLAVKEICDQEEPLKETEEAEEGSTDTPLPD